MVTTRQAELGMLCNPTLCEKQVVAFSPRSLRSKTKSILTTNLSAEQIVAYCYHVNYVQINYVRDGNDNMASGEVIPIESSSDIAYRQMGLFTRVHFAK